MSLKHTLRALLADVLILSLAASRGHAQAVDYNSLEQVFGEPITTSVTGSPQRASEAPASMTIVTQDDIRRTGADNLPDVLQYVTGLDIRRYSLGQADVAIRGYNQPLSPRMLVLVNGRQVYLDDFGYVDWNSIPVALSEIRQIEVVKGPQSALFGFNAAAGVINILTFDPLLDSTETATVRSGTQDMLGGEAVGTGHIGHVFGARISVGGFREREFTSSGFDYPLDRNGRLNIDMRWQAAPKLLLRAQGSLIDNRFLMETPTSVFSASENRSNDIEVGAAADTRFGLFDLDLYRNQTYSEKQVIAGGVYLPFYLTDTSVVRVVKASDLLKLGSRNTIRIGLEYRNTLGTSDNVYGGTMGYDDYAASLTWNTQLFPALSLVNALRLDHATLHSTARYSPLSSLTDSDYDHTTITQPSFNSGLVYAASSADSFRLTASRGLQMPSLYDLGFQVGAGPGVLQSGDPSLSPTAVWNLDLGYTRAMPTYGSELTVDGFLQRNTSLIAAPGVGPTLFGRQGIVLISANIGSSDEAGLEVGIKGQSAGGMHWNASYRFVAISQDITGDLIPSVGSSFDNGTPRHVIILGGGYARGRWEFDVNGRWQSTFTDYASGGAAGQPPLALVVGDYVTFSGRIGYNLTRNLTLAVSGQQFNISRIRESSGLLVERRGIASIGVHF